MLARKTLDTLQLWEHPLFAGAPKGPAKVNLRWALAQVAVFLRSEEVPGSDAPGADETAAKSKAIDAFLRGLTVAPIRNSRLVDVKYRSPDPALAAAVVNALARNYIEQNLEYKFMASKEASDWLGERLGEQRKQVEGAEAKLQRYREQNDAISLVDRENIVVQKLADLNAAVTRAKTERIQKEAMYNQLRVSQNDPASLDTFPAILGEQLHPAAEDRAGDAVSASWRSCRRSSATGTRRSWRSRARSSRRRRSCRGRSARSCSRCGASTRPRWRRRTA